MKMTKAFRQAKIDTLVEDYGHETAEGLMEACVLDSVAPAICTVSGCDYTTDMEGDQERGYCEVCGNNSVQSIFILCDLI